MYLREVHPPKKCSDDFEIAEKQLAEIRNSFIKKLADLNPDSSGLKEEIAPLIIFENEPVLESVRMTELIGKSKEVLKDMENQNLSALE